MDERNFTNENDTLENGSDGYDYYQYFVDVIKPQLSERDFLPPALPISVKVILTICYLIIIVISIVGNVMVICIICRYHKMRTVTNTFLGSLAVSGFFLIVYFTVEEKLNVREKFAINCKCSIISTQISMLKIGPGIQ